MLKNKCLNIYAYINQNVKSNMNNGDIWLGSFYTENKKKE